MKLKILLIILVSIFTDNLSFSQNCNAHFIKQNECDPFQRFWSDSSSISNITYHWSFGDSMNSTFDTTEHQFAYFEYPDSGRFKVCLITDDGMGCRDTFCDTVTPNLYCDSCNIGFDSLRVSKTSDTTVSFAVVSPYNIDTSYVYTGLKFHWDFGDGTYDSSTGGYKEHVYDTGSYYYCVTIYDTLRPHCYYTYCDSVNIKDLDKVSVYFQSIKDSKIYPNPTSAQITISLNSTIDKGIELELVDLQGRALISKLYPPNYDSYIFDVGDIKDGVYILRIKLNGYFVNRKIIVSRE